MLILPVVATATVLVLRSALACQQLTVPANTADEKRRTQYKISLTLDFDKRSYTGSEWVRWTNLGDHSTSFIFFHLYSNLRSEQPSPTAPATADFPEPSHLASDEPRLDVIDVRSAPTDSALPFALDELLSRVAIKESI